MALGCPVIAFAQGAAPELIVHGKTGFLVHDFDAMVSCMAHIDEIDRAVTRQHVEEHFSALVMAEKYLRIYQNVIRASKVASNPVLDQRSPVIHAHSLSLPSVHLAWILAVALSKKSISSRQLFDQLFAQDINMRLHSKGLLAEEAPSDYKDAQQVVNVVHTRAWQYW